MKDSDSNHKRQWEAGFSSSELGVKHPKSYIMQPYYTNSIYLKIHLIEIHQTIEAARVKILASYKLNFKMRNSGSYLSIGKLCNVVEVAFSILS